MDNLKQAKKLLTLKDEPMLALFDEVQELQKLISELISSQDKTKQVEVINSIEEQILKTLEDIKKKEPPPFPEIPEVEIPPFPEIPKTDLSKVESLLSELISKEQKEEIVVSIDIV